MATLTETLTSPGVQSLAPQTLPSAAPNPQPITLEFIQPLPLYEHEKPYYMVLSSPANPADPAGDNDGEGTEGLQDPHSETNIQLHLVHDIPVTDARGRETEFSLEKKGFTFLKRRSTVLQRIDGEGEGKMGRWEADGEDGWMEYVKETAGLVEEVVGAERVVCYDYRRRSNDREKEAAKTDTDRSKYIAPITVVHIDHTLEGGFRRAQRHLTEVEAAEYLQSGNYRVRIINVWRPLLDKVEDAPLALCDPNSVAAEDLLEVDRVTEHWVGEVYYVKYNANQRWYWLRNMRADEVCVFTSFDSHPSPGPMNFVPHASFKDLLARPDAPTRESCEVRIIAIHKR